mgnify:CR=1 FL=1
MGIVGVDHCHALFGQAFKNFTLGARDGLNAAQMLNVRTPRVVDEGHVGASQPGQRTDFLGVFELDMNLREFKTSAKSVHYFQKG